VRPLLPFTLPLFLLLLLALWWSGPSSRPAPGRLVFSDEFDDGVVDEAKWDFEYPRHGDMAHSNWDNGEAQWYKRENVTEVGGRLLLIARRERTVSPESGRAFGYSSGLIQSKPSFSFRYGYMEARMRLPKGSGLWPAFWTWPSNEQWPPEIDVMEFYGDNPTLTHQTYHYAGGSSGSEAAAEDWTSGWHTFAVDWRPDGLDWYVDRRRVKSAAKAPAVDMYLIANLAICSPKRCAAPDSSTRLPAALRVDYVRVWKR